MRIAMIGMGKLGYPVACVIASQGHEVHGYDVNDDVFKDGPRQYLETDPNGITPFDSWYSEQLDDGDGKF